MNVDPPAPEPHRPGRRDGADRPPGAERPSGLERPSGARAYDAGAAAYRSRVHRRRRLRRHRRRAYIRSVYFLPSMATLGNAVCGFGAMYVAAFDDVNVGDDPWARALLAHKFLAAAYLIILAMVFDALDGRLARFARHTTDFGGQLDSLADAVSFGAAPAFIALLLVKAEVQGLPFALTRLIWATGAIYFSCACIRLARFNVSNEHGEQHHFSFLGLPSPGAAAAVVGAILIQQDLRRLGQPGSRVDEVADAMATGVTWLLPVIVLATGLLMVSAIRYPHLVNRYLRGRRSVARLVGVLAVLMIVIFQHRYAFGVAAIAYAMYGPAILASLRLRPRPEAPASAANPGPDPGAGPAGAAVRGESPVTPAR